MVVTMGCRESTVRSDKPSLKTSPSFVINEHGFLSVDEPQISGVSYQKNVERIANDIAKGSNNLNTTGNNENNLNGHGKNISRATKKNFTERRKKRDNLPMRAKSERLTPSKLDFDTISISSWDRDNNPYEIDLGAITEIEKHWNFPKWGHYKKCTFCGCDCHKVEPKTDNRKRSTIRKQNNQKMPQEGLTSGGCTMALMNLLAMVRVILALYMFINFCYNLCCK